jgi:hypothetical protein
MIVARKRKDGSVGYMVRLRVIREGAAYHETETFDRRPAAAAWMERREAGLVKPGGIDRAKADDHTLAKAMDRYTAESIKEIGRTKAQVLRAIKNYPIADMPCSQIKSKDIIEFLQSLTAKPQSSCPGRRRSRNTSVSISPALPAPIAAWTGPSAASLGWDWERLLSNGLPAACRLRGRSLRFGTCDDLGRPIYDYR